MNYLAHIYLSYNNTDLEIGNFIADSVKGNDFLEYPEVIKQGIILHRKIDTYTDQHTLVREAKNYFSAYGLYAGIITDIIFDHFLAYNWNTFHKTPLLNFSENFYKNLEQKWEILPNRIHHLYPYMIEQNWLFMYRSTKGISDILFQMNRRTKNISKMNYAIIELLEHYNDLENLFKLFFEDLEKYVTEEINTFSFNQS